MGQMGSILDKLEPVPVNITSTNLYTHAQTVKVLNPEYLKFPFIDDKETVEYIFGSRVIFIMRGLPGSGKSTVAKAIKGTYPNSVLCSDDDIFMTNSRYELNRDNLHDAQVSCQQKARRACEDGVNVVVIDNANIRRWEIEYYLELAIENSYVVVIVEPRTPWKWDPETLAEKNKQKVNVEVLFAKIEMWDTIVPLYFGWFLNTADSHILSLVGQAHLEECLKLSEFADDFKNFSEASEIADMLQYYTLPASCPKGMLHCTSKFCLGGKIPGSLEYSRKEEVVSNTGRSYQLCIVGLFMTPRTFGARVKLDEEMLTLWANDQESPRRRSSSGSSHGRRYIPSNSANPGSSAAEEEQPPDPKTLTNKASENHRPPCRASLVTFKKFEPSFHPTSGVGSQAHVTLGCAEDISPVTTGFDLREIISCEEDSEIAEKALTFTLDRGYLRNYGESRWMLYLHQQIVVGTLFTGHYSLS